MSNYFDLQNGPILTTPSSITVPKISTIGYPGDDTAADPAGGQTITLTGNGFEAGASVIINGNAVGVVSVVSSTTITFTSPANSAGSYVLYVVNTDGGTAVAVPGIQYSGVPNWTTAAGSLGSYTETVAISNTVTATGDNPITYSLFSGSLPTGATLNSSTGLISGTSPVAASPTTFTFTIRATDAQLQDTNRQFSLTINPDVVTWVTPANGTTYTSTANSAISNVSLSATAASGQNVSYSANALPAGLSISGSNITGTPTVVANSSTLLTATAATTNATATRTINWVINVASDAFFPYITSLLSANTPASTFVADASTNNFNVIAYNDARPNNFGPYTPGYYSVLFNSGSNTLTVPDNAAWDLNTDYTVEAFCYLNSYNTSDKYYIVAQVATGQRAWGLGVHNGRLEVYYSANGSNDSFVYSNSFTVTIGQWYHFAFTRSSAGVYTFYVNGVATGSTTDATAVFQSNQPLTIGQFGNFGISTLRWDGFISNLRIVRGSVVYTGNFTPSTTPLTAITNTALLTCQSNRFIDNSTNNFTVTVNGSPQISGFDPFVPSGSFAGLGSGYFDGSGDYLDTPSSSAFVLGSSGNFTIECWIYPNGTQSSAAIIVSTYTDFNSVGGYLNKWNLGFSTTGVLTWYDSTGNAGINSSNFPVNVWSHVAVVRNGATITMYVNGVSVGTQTSSQSYTSQSPVRVGLVPGASAFNGYISNLRIVNGTAVYTTTFTPPTTSLTAIANTQLLILQNNQPNNNNMFLDNSTSNFNITRNGNTTQGSFSPYGGGWSNYFDGSSSLLYTQSGSTFPAPVSFLNGASGIGTIEFWVYPLSSSQGANIYEFPPVIAVGDTYFSLGITTGNKARFYWWTGAPNNLDSTGTVSFNTWTHVAAVRNGTTVTLYVNGVSSGSISYTGWSWASAANGTLLNIGLTSPGSARYFNGYVSNLRVVNGTAVYTATFTPPTAPFTPITNTSLLTCADNRFIDDSASNYLLTRNGSPTVQRFNPFNPVITTPTSYSGFFDGTGDYLTLAPGSAFAFGTGDFTVECWYYPTSTPTYGYIVDARNSGQTNNWAFAYGLTGVNPGDSGKFGWFDGSTVLQESTVSTITNSWNHLCYVRSGTTGSLFVNGVRVATATNSTNINVSPTISYIGQRYSSAPDQIIFGYISNLRTVKGTAVYDPTQSTLTVPTSPLTAIANTSLLTLQSPTFIDNSTNNFTITAVGDTAPRQFNPFGWTNTTGSSAAYTPALYSGSAYFDGSGDYLTIPNNTLLQLATATPFTIEAWVYLNAIVSGDQGIISKRQSTNEWQMNIHPSFGFLNFWNGSTTYQSNISLTTGQWYHLVVSWDATTLRFFVNGAMGSTYTGFTVGSSTNQVNIGCILSDGSFPINGYISDLRVTKGQARYTSRFTPPVAPLTALPNTTLLNNMTSAAIYDSAMLTNYETLGNAGVVTSLKKYGNSSLYFDGTGDYLPAQTSPNFAFGTGDFTVEAWVNTGSISSVAQRGWLQTSATAGGLSTSYTAGIVIHFGASTNGTVATNVGGTAYTSAGGAVAVDTWNHIAVTRSSGTVNVWLNGVSVASGSGNTANLTGQNLVVGGYYSTGYLFVGYLDDVRITRGLARYTSTFTPPSTPVFTS